MIQLSGQQTHVVHEFEQLHERQVIAVSNTAGQQTQNLSGNEKLKNDTAESEEAFTVTLSNELLLKKKLLEDISGYTFETYNGHKQLSASSKTETLSEQQSTGIFIINGQQASNDSLLLVREKRYEYERLDYSTTLTLENEDGSTTESSLSLSFSRELEIDQQLLLTGAEFKDPLVVNLGGGGQLFGDEKTRFDLDADGTKEDIPTLAPSVFYLAYDQNQNGKVDTGRELFGALTGNGFNELAQYDSDGNRLIDAQDQEFDRLQLWDGKNRLTSLSDSGISAISLQAEDTPFTFTNELGTPKAQLRQTSVFITDEQKLGAIHQIDFAV